MSRDWVWTLFDTKETGEIKELIFDEDNIRYICYGYELTKTGRKHLQGFAIFNRTCRKPKCKQWLGNDRCHVEPRRGTRSQARDYCRKERGEFFEWGRFDAMTNTELFKQPISFLKDTYPEFYCRYSRGLEKLQPKGPKWRDVTVVWLHGEPGTGKTRYAMDNESVFKLDRPYKWWDGYENEEIIVLDDVDEQDFIDNRGMFLNILDGYRLRLETKGSHSWANWTKVYVTSNWNPYVNLMRSECWKRRIDDVVKM